MNKTGIEYLDYTWNPIVMRCTRISEGCDNCWHLRTCDRLKHNPRMMMNIYAGKNSPWPDPLRLTEPLHHKKPARIGVQFMGDLFHDDVMAMGQNPGERIFSIYDVMIKAKQHTFLVLTKRPENARKWYFGWHFGSDDWSHIWLGVTAENQTRAHERIPILLKIPAAVRFVSLEPMLESIRLLWLQHGLLDSKHYHVLDWVIVGGETGPGAREMDPDWARSIRDQCKEVGVPFFMKQMSKKAPIPPDLQVREWPWETRPQQEQSQP